MKFLKFTLYILIFFSSCQTEKEKDLVFEKIDFELDNFEWDANGYKMSQIILDSVLEKKGSQMAATQLSYIGSQKKMLEIWDKTGAAKRDELTEEQIKDFQNYKPQNAVDFILAQSKAYQITIINEAHHMPQHRVLSTQLLQGLYEQGYRHLGLEAYFNSSKTDSVLNANQYPVLKSGFYTKEPQFGNLIREALKIGFKVFGYESQGHESGTEREINQARNIESYMKKFPNEKVFIHCGFDHAAEGLYSGKWEKTMAERVKEYIEIDPLTINQTIYSEKSKREYENPFYQFAKVENATVFVNKEGKSFGKYRGESYMDIAVFHPFSKIYNRPNWLIYGKRMIYELDLKAAEMEPPFLVMAYLEGEKIGSAVPYDIQETADKKVKLVLEKNKTYNIVLTKLKGKSIATKFEAK